MRLPLADMHFHCPDCDPVLVRGTTRAICGHVIQPAIVGDGPQRKCPACKRVKRAHVAGHKGGRR
ncbi:hypothetical protein HRW23_22030 [Streptomyces lunaelactis]|uniref:hypothetical protein n=1 Tax=Streptomyces lunaelactis TaxID=1535768 RepID=UPI00158468DA|nr:hypothetical protein [Streptomyces lunaelactis]NUK80027.1 hypothetical protein [Streptomyces lunaelactis]